MKVVPGRLLPFLYLLLSLLPLSCRSVDEANCALIAALQAVDEDAVKQELQNGASPNARQYGNETALGTLIRQYKHSHQDRRERIEKLLFHLLDQGADPNEKHHGFTPLQLAVGQRSEEMVSRLIAFGANPNQETQAGYAPIWQAVFDNNYKIGLILLRAGANPNARGPKRQTPLQYLRAKGFQKTRLMLHLRFYGGI